MNFTLKIWRQTRNTPRGAFATYHVTDVSPDISLLEMLDILNEDLIRRGEEPVEYDNDCREGICGTCGLVIDGVAHGRKPGCTTCEVRMREFTDGQTITIEPFRARPFPLIKDLVVDRDSFDRVIQKGGYTSVNVGSAPDANAVLVPKAAAELAMDAAACIGCGACVAACPNASASLFVGAKVSQFALLPQGRVEATERVRQMVRQMDREGFGLCSNHAECEAVCPKRVSIANIARLRREYLKAGLRG